MVARAAIVDRWGRPFEPEAAPKTNGHHANGVRSKSILHIGGSYEQGLSLSRMMAAARARDPFLGSTWVFSAALRTALASSQADYTVFRETDETLRLRAKRLGELGMPRAGKARRAVQRWIRKSASKRVLGVKALEPVLAHPVMDLLHRPNPYQSGNELMILAVLWLAVRGESTWILTNADGLPSELDTPERIWPVPPDSLTPVHEMPTGGEIVAWELVQPRWIKGYRGGVRLRLPLASVVQFKIPNPADITRGLSPLSATAGSIELDMAMRSALRKLIENGSMPSNILYHPEDLDVKARQEIREEFEELGKEGRTAVLSGGLKVASIGFSPQQMGYAEQPQFLRDEVIAAMGTTESALGLSSATTYASALVNDYGFWEKGVLPLLKLIETGMDEKFFLAESDRTFGMFDLSGVEALRAGVMDKAQTASVLCGGALHMPPTVAYEVVGLDGVPEYEGDDVALAVVSETPKATGTVAELIAGDLKPEPVAPPPPPAAPAADPAAEEVDDEDEIPAAASRIARIAKARRANRNAEFVEMQGVAEEEMTRIYRGFVAGERRMVLAAFDEIGGKARARLKEKDPDQLDLRVVLPVGEESAKRLALSARRLQVDSLIQVFDFTEDDIGIPTFSIDDQAILSFARAHEASHTKETAASIRTSLAKALEEGLRENDTLSELRSRIGQVYDIAASSHKTLLVARTSTASFANGVRDQMFRLQGVEQIQWDNAGDEHVRADHITFGESGPHPVGFNFLSLVGLQGRLEFPGDLRAPFGTRANCRCSAGPA